MNVNNTQERSSDVLVGLTHCCFELRIDISAIKASGSMMTQALDSNPHQLPKMGLSQDVFESTHIAISGNHLGFEFAND